MSFWQPVILFRLSSYNNFIFNYDKDYSGFGAAQITNKWISTPYGEWIENPDYPGDTTHNRGYGLRCYIPISNLNLPKEVQIELAKSCTFCFLKKQIAGISDFDKNFTLEPIYGQKDIEGATIYMKRMIKLIVDACRNRGCGDTDIFIAAALAQNGPGFTIYSLEETELQYLPITEQTEDIKMNWNRWFKAGDPIDTSTQLSRFTQAIQGLILKNWTVPDIKMDKVNDLINRRFPE